MQCSTSRLNAAHGPFKVAVSNDGRGIPATDDPFHGGFPDWATGPGVVKLVSRFTLTIGDHDPIRSNCPFFYGSTDKPHEIADAESVLCSVLDDLASIAPYVPECGFGPGLTVRADETAAMVEWMDDLGAFSDGLNRAELRGWIRGWGEINTTWILVLETGEIDERGLRSLLNFRGWED